MRVIFLPFQFIWAFIGLLFSLMGRLISAIVGLVFIVAGLFLTITVIGSFIGIPMMILGFLLLIRSIF